jgi:hypothetical protein
MNAIKQRLLSGWHFMRILRLGLGIWILVMAIQAKDIAFGLFSAFFIYIALAGVGCCGANGCYVPESKAAENEANDIDYEEVK